MLLLLIHLVRSPAKKKKKTTIDNSSSHGTIEHFFKKPNSTISIIDQQSESRNAIGTIAQKSSSIIELNDDEFRSNYTKCSICQNLVPKANIFIHQIRCYK